jgi:hypothetical protein
VVRIVCSEIVARAVHLRGSRARLIRLTGQAREFCQETDRVVVVVAGAESDGRCSGGGGG